MARILIALSLATACICKVEHDTDFLQPVVPPENQVLPESASPVGGKVGEGMELAAWRSLMLKRREEAKRRMNIIDSTDTLCGHGLQAIGKINPPWEDTDVKVSGAKTYDMCAQCETQLQNMGLLKQGSSCYESSSIFAWGRRRYHIKRTATEADTQLTPMKPEQSLLFSAMNGAGPFPLGRAPLPKALRGMFWLGDQKESSALTTFGPNGNADGAWCSNGTLIVNQYRVRVNGDKVWSFANMYSLGGEAAKSLDLVYDFVFDSSTDPHFAHIMPVVTTLGGFGTWLSKQEWALDFDMELLSPEQAASKGFPGSVVWLRRSYALGIEIKPKEYLLTQVMDENGQRIEPAWTKFLNYQSSAAAPSYPGEIFYRAAYPMR